MTALHLDDGVHSCTFISNYGDEITVNIEDLELIQFTGIKDRNGEDVWEGDIVHFSYGIPPVGVNAPIEFLNGSFYAITDGHKPRKAILGELNDYVGDFEIYGNIYENPELAGGTQKEGK